MTIEEKTPKGYVLKINLNKQSFIAFDRLGGAVYAGEHKENAIHKVPIICFLGKQFILKQRMLDRYFLVKVSRGKLLLPYYVAGKKDRHYHLLKCDESLDMIPVKILRVESILQFIRIIEEGIKPHFVFLQSDMDENDRVVLENRYTEGEYITIDLYSAKLVSQERAQKDKEEDYSISLNTMSTNPVFLAAIHLRDFNLSSIKQILFDFDLTPYEADFIVSYLEIIKKRKTYPNPEKNEAKIDDLIIDFNFYSALMKVDMDTVKKMIEGVKNSTEHSSFMTIFAKAQSVERDGTPDELDFVDFENLLYEKKEELDTKSSEVKADTN
jgi:hypothetical protein